MASRPSSRPPSAADERVDRLAELVAGLTGCQKGGALHAVREHGSARDALKVVARAMVEVDAPPPEGFRVAGFLREDALVHHSSLRRWDRLHDEQDRPEDLVAHDRFAPRTGTAVHSPRGRSVG